MEDISIISTSENSHLDILNNISFDGIKEGCTAKVKNGMGMVKRFRYFERTWKEVKNNKQLT